MMQNTQLKEKLLRNGVSYKDYFERAQKNLENQAGNDLSEEEKHLLEYTKLNIKRSERIAKTYQVSDELKSVLKGINKPQLWMVLTEPWCGDSAQNLPYIAIMADINPLIELKIVLRDENPDIMDLYLTNGTRSIPILAAFDSEGNELFKWGPRPQEAVELVKNAKALGKSKDQFIEELHLWYGRNRGKAIESEFITLLK
jgi:hypothetical protein